MADLDAVFKAYDIRGTVPDQLDAPLCRRIGSAVARFVSAHPDGGGRVLVAHDMRPTGPELVEAFTEGLTAQGVDAVHLGLASTDMLYFASGSLDAPGVVFTASHNPAEYNGIKLCLSGAKPIGADSGLGDIKVMAASDAPAAPQPGRTSRHEVLDEFVDHVRSFVDGSALDGLRVVADTANGMGGLVVPAVFDALPVELDLLYPELDGTFPNHPADPIQPENQVDLKALVVERGADVGLAFDGDADRVFLVDEQANGISGSLTTALVARGVLARQPGATILHNLICSKAVAEVVRECGGTPVRTKVGHSYIKAVMAETGAAFGGEHSGHYYFRDNYRADSGLIAALVVLEGLARHDGPLSDLLSPFDRYAASGEINTTGRATRAAVIEARGPPATTAPTRTGSTGSRWISATWWFNLRPIEHRAAPAAQPRSRLDRRRVPNVVSKRSAPCSIRKA